MELAPYQLGEPVYRVAYTQNYSVSDKKECILYHEIYDAEKFNFLGGNENLPVSPNCNFFTALKESIEKKCGYYYCLILNGAIISMQYIEEPSHIAFVEVC